MKTNIKINYPFVAVTSAKREKMPMGWTVYRYTKKGITLCKMKRPKRYFGMNTEFIKAMANVRKWYGINLPTIGWSDKMSVKLKRHDTTEIMLNKIKTQFI